MNQLKTSTNQPSNLHKIYQGDEEEEDEDDVMSSGWKLYEKIFSYLDPQNLLTVRRVCSTWNQIVVNNVCKDYLWSKMCVKIDKNQNWPDCTTLNSSLNIFYSPNFHFIQCDFRLDIFHDFLITRGPFLKYLKITDCIVSLPILQILIFTCEQLEHFQMNGLHQNLVIVESIFPKKIKLHKLPHLRTLILKSRLESSNSKNKLEEDIENNLSCGFIQDLIEYSNNLQQVQLIGFNPQTGSNFMSILTHRGRYKNLSEFHLLNIPPVIKSVHLIPLCVTASHIHLKKLTISPQSSTQFNDFGNIIIREILKNYRETLEELNITNCPVNSTIFRFLMPNLRFVIVIGTNIKSCVIFRHQMPKLEKFIYRQNISSPKQVIERVHRHLFQSAAQSQLNLQNLLQQLQTKLGHVMNWDCVQSQTFVEMMAMRCWTRNKSKNDNVGSSMSILPEFNTCSWIDFTSLVFLTSLLIILCIYGVSSIFSSYSPLIFFISIFILILYEIYGHFQVSIFNR